MCYRMHDGLYGIDCHANAGGTKKDVCWNAEFVSSLKLALRNGVCAVLVMERIEDMEVISIKFYWLNKTKVKLCLTGEMRRRIP